MGVADVERVVVEVEIPGGVSLEGLLRGVKYKVVEGREGLAGLVAHARTVKVRSGAPRVATSELLERERR